MIAIWNMLMCGSPQPPSTDTDFSNRQYEPEPNQSPADKKKELEDEYQVLLIINFLFDC